MDGHLANSLTFAKAKPPGNDGDDAGGGRRVRGGGWLDEMKRR